MPKPDRSVSITITPCPQSLRQCIILAATCDEGASEYTDIWNNLVDRNTEVPTHSFHRDILNLVRDGYLNRTATGKFTLSAQGRDALTHIRKALAP